MSWSDNLKAYLGAGGCSSYSYACLMTIDGNSCFAEAGETKEKIVAAEIANTVKAVAGDGKFQGVTVGGNKYVFLTDNNGVSAFKKKNKAFLFFHGTAYAACVFAESEPRVLMSACISLKDQLAGAGLS